MAPVNESSDSTVGFAAVPDGGDVESVSVVMEADAVVADAEPKFGRLDVLKTLHVALARCGPGREEWAAL